MCVLLGYIFFYEKLALGATLAVTGSCILQRLLHNSRSPPFVQHQPIKNKIVNRLRFPLRPDGDILFAVFT